MNMALIAGGSQLLGGLLGGGRRDKRAMRQLAEIQRAADDAVEHYRADQDRVKALRAEDEARLAAATGYDLEKLRDDARAAGFNPLTVLGATGGAGYDGRGAVLQTPFISMGDAMRIRVDARLGAAPLAVENAGYVGDAIAGAGAAFTSAALSQAQMLADKEIQMAMASMAKNASEPARSEARASVASPFDVATFPVGDTLDYGALAADGGPLVTQDGKQVYVRLAEGRGTWVSSDLARRKGWKPGDMVSTGDFDDEFNQLVGSAWAAESWVHGFMDDSWMMRLARSAESRGRARNAANSATGFPEYWGVSPTPWDQGDMVFRW